MRIREQIKEKYLQASSRCGFIMNFSKKLLTFADFCTIFYINII